MANRKRIGVLIGQAEEGHQTLFMEGFLAKAFSYDYDVCVFAMYNKYQETTAREIGESTIFSLVNYDVFDGFVVLMDTIQTKGMADEIEEHLKAYFHGPVICVDKESKYFTTLMIPHYAPVKKLVSHLIDVHGYEDIAFLTGKRWHPHSAERLSAYMDAMAEHDLEVPENRVFYGDFWYSSGETMVEKLLQDKEHMPRAIACANDQMAIGVAQALVANGYRIPEDIAVVGYDSIEDGRTSPSPITSAPIPSKACGRHAAIMMHAMLLGKEVPAFDPNPELFIGGSCGCSYHIVPKDVLRESWGNDDSEGSFYARSNHLMEDMLTKTEFSDVMNAVYSYVFQIREFDSFTICLNSQWKDVRKLHDRDAQWGGYTSQMFPVLQCKKDITINPLNYETTFDKKLILPELYEEREKPAVFFFTPLHFEERCLGYAAINYGNEAKCYNETYWLWLRTVMHGLESFRRMYELQLSNALLESTHVRDSLTGLYNYKGLVQQVEGFKNRLTGVIAADIKGLAEINDKYGREEGNRAINLVANVLNRVMEEGSCCRLGTGEFVGAVVSDEEKTRIHNIKKTLQEELKNLRDIPYELQVYIGTETGEVKETDDFERLINTAVAVKNGNKITERKLKNSEALTEEEQKEAEVVREILDENKFAYHFQPIVDAKTGEIFAYEALMRAQVTPFMSPLKILKYAEHLDRLYDVEKATFFNVLECIKRNETAIGNRKVFINSIPGNRLEGNDADLLRLKMEEQNGSVVVELTEQAEIPDDALMAMKTDYAGMGIETAVDDYGTGYSNVTNLLRYMPNYVKIDRMLLSKIQESPQKQHFVREIIEFAHDNDIKALAEGVETTEEIQMVIHLGVDLIQGYYTAKPAPELVPGIDPKIKEEIVRFYQQETVNKGRKVYVAGKESRIYQTKLRADKYSMIEVMADKTIFKDITITGVPGMNCEMTLDIQDGYQGRIVLENVSLFGKKQKECIRIGNNCEVTFVLKGDNQLSEGGICVPESTKVVFEGEGDLTITIGKDDYYGIGNELTLGHGSILFEQDGCIRICGSGNRGIAIGSGKGGETKIHRGRYEVELLGEEGIGIGAFYGDVNLVIESTNLHFNIDSAKNVGLGSFEGNVDVSMAYALFRCVNGGTLSAGIGTISGKRTGILIQNANVNMDMRAQKLSALGMAEEESVIELRDIGLVVKAEGKEAIACGNFAKTSKMQFWNCDVKSKVKNSLDFDMGASEENIYICNGRSQYTHNGSEIERKIVEGEF